MANSNRHNAQSWPYPRHKEFEAQLRQSNANWFAEKKFSVNNRIPYLLEKWEDWPNNIIVPEVALFIQNERDVRQKHNEGFPLHKYIHHGLSSQAMLFNLIGPLIIQDDFSPLKSAFEKHGIFWPKEKVVARFEHENRLIFNEDSGQPTSIDLVIHGQDNKQSLFIESKLVEHEFGGCSVFAAGDCNGSNPAKNFRNCYLHHLSRKYWLLLEEYGFLDTPTWTGPICPLAIYYQFFREVLFAIESGGDFVLLHDQRNPTFYCGEAPNGVGLMPFLVTFIPKELRKRVHSVSIQQVIVSYKDLGEFEWLSEFEKKYNLVAPSRK